MFKSMRSKFGVAALALAAAASGVLAQAPSMDPIDFPVDEASVVTAIVTAGATILLLVFGTVIGFALVRKLFRRLRGAV